MRAGYNIGGQATTHEGRLKQMRAGYRTNLFIKDIVEIEGRLPRAGRNGASLSWLRLPSAKLKWNKRTKSFEIT